MKKNNQYKSLKHKSFRQALKHMLETDFSVLGSGKVLDLYTDSTVQLIDDYYPERIAPGKIVISAISKDAPKGHQRGVKGLPQVPVVLDVINENILNRFADGEKLKSIKRDYVLDIFRQAYKQGGVISSMDAAVITKMSSATINKYVREYMSQNNEIIPTRGFIHDVGPSISHKGIIVGKFLKGGLPPDIARQVNHSQQAVDRYIKDYERVKVCIKQNMDTTTTKRATGMSKKLIEKYEELYKEYEGTRNGN